MSKSVRIVLSLSSYPAMLDQADDLLELASTDEKRQHTLAACASLVMAAALDQASLTKCQAERADPGHPDAQRFITFEAGSLRNRVFGLPALLTNGKFEMDRRRPESQALHALISLRNELMHISEEPEVRDVEFSEEEFGDLVDAKPNIVKRLNEHLEEMMPSIASPWFFTRLPQATLFRSAIAVYDEEVLTPPPAQIRKGKLVVPKRG